MKDKELDQSPTNVDIESTSEVADLTSDFSRSIGNESMYGSVQEVESITMHFDEPDNPDQGGDE